VILNLFFLAAFGLLCLLSAESWRRLIVRILNFQPVIPRRLPPAVSLGLFDVGIMFAIWLLGQAAAIAWAQATSPLGVEALAGDDLGRFIGISAISQMVSTVVGLSVLLVRYRSLKQVGIQFQYWREDIGLGIESFFLVVPPLLILQWLLTRLVDYEHATLSALAEHPGFLTLISVWAAAVLVAPICEEVFFRGILQSWFQRLKNGSGSLDQMILGGSESIDLARHKTRQPDDLAGDLPQSVVQQVRNYGSSAGENPYGASPVGHPRTSSLKSDEREEYFSSAVLPVFLSAFLFALVHIGQGLAPVPLFFLGLVLGFIFIRTRSLLPCIVLHMGLNGFSMFWFTIGVLTQEISKPA
jgi:membrane protease YdiL (CAAX protease family)